MNYKDKTRLLRLRKTFDDNYKITQLYTAYLEHCPEIINSDMVDELCADGTLTKADAIRALVCEILGLDFENDEERRLIRDYINPSIRILSPERYTSDSYFQKIKIESKISGNWEFRRERYPAYRAVICDDIVTLADFTEIPPLGFFTEPFEFPAVLEGGNEWMTLTPVDMDTCRDAIAAAHGRVVTFGLGLGYYAFRAAEKPDVESVTVVERSPEVIKLFCDELLPQMPCRDKIKVVEYDAFEYAKDVMPNEDFDIAFVDIWRDGGDGAEAYVKMKPLEALSGNTKFLHWIEGFILSRLRSLRFEELWSLVQKEDIDYDTVIRELTDKLALVNAKK